MGSKRSVWVIIAAVAIAWGCAWVNLNSRIVTATASAAPPYPLPRYTVRLANGEVQIYIDDESYDNSGARQTLAFVTKAYPTQARFRVVWQFWGVHYHFKSVAFYDRSKKIFKLYDAGSLGESAGETWSKLYVMTNVSDAMVNQLAKASNRDTDSQTADFLTLKKAGAHLVTSKVKSMPL